MFVEDLVKLFGNHIPFGTKITTIDVFEDFVNVVCLTENDKPFVRSFFYDGGEFTEDKETVWTISDEE
jgi:hypothetical protein